MNAVLERAVVCQVLLVSSDVMSCGVCGDMLGVLQLTLPKSKVYSSPLLFIFYCF